MRPNDLPIHELSDMLSSGELTSEQLTECCLEAAANNDTSVGAFLTLCSDDALRAAREADRLISSGRGGILTGIPFAVKDNICTEGIRTTCASKLLSGYIPPYSATAVRSLENINAVMLGKTNMDEFGMGSSCENSAFRPTENPLAPGHVPGGSSGGSAAAVASGMVCFALGSDTGGSVRQPAAFCSVVGLKPTYGRVSRFGLVPFASSMDTIGPITRDVRSNAVVFEAIAGRDPLDMTSSFRTTETVSGSLDLSDIRGLRIAVPDMDSTGTELSPCVEKALREAVSVFTSLGAACSETVLPFDFRTLAAYYAISAAEASSNLARFDGIRYGSSAPCGGEHDVREFRSLGFGTEVQRRIILGTYVLSSGYGRDLYFKALSRREYVRSAFRAAFSEYDLVLSPVTPDPPPPLGKFKTSPSEMYYQDVFTVPANLAGLPAISVPAGRDSVSGLPVGIQLTAPHFSEAILFRTAYLFEKEISDGKIRE
ncbi:MAG: Asp-tRNA(Asn)/Glu-tRNA(Gln) amidotransferase subunit GatA [Clostridia bacterium]|nr:Asp-tRNA(Asn)/Glu-tRNA(Gln) amidotransferase subunit GatA [Clostridia bacterium]